MKQFRVTPDTFEDLISGLDHAQMSDFTLIILITGIGYEGSGELCTERTCVPVRGSVLGEDALSSAADKAAVTYSSLLSTELYRSYSTYTTLLFLAT